jgi:long-chain-fatty-acid---luciferin-component ligase
VAVQEATLSAVTSIDRVIFGQDPFRLPESDQAAFQIELVRNAVSFHLEQCPFFARYAQRVNFVLDHLDGEQGLSAVPQIPTGVFKRTTVRSETPEVDVRRCTSSGTRGNLSVIWRDRQTIQRLFGSIQAGITEFLGDPHEDEVVVINLGPSQQEAGDLWFAYVLSLVELGYETRHMVRDGVLDGAETAEAIMRARSDAKMVVVIGSPAVMYDVTRACPGDRRSDSDGARVVAITAGGWKGRDGREVSRHLLTEAVVNAFGVEDPRDVRDTFNQVELNTVLFECECGGKHVPPWLCAFTRSPRSLAPQDDGEVGLLSYLDPSALSYPAFIISDDLGVVKGGGCACGRPGKTLELYRRVDRNEHWGCALKMNQLTMRDTGEEKGAGK